MLPVLLSDDHDGRASCTSGRLDNPGSLHSFLYFGINNRLHGWITWPVPSFDRRQVFQADLVLGQWRRPGNRLEFG